MKLPTTLIIMTMLSSSSIADDYTVFFGTSREGSRGIYATTFSRTSGKLAEPANLAARIDSPGFLAQHPALPILYSTGYDPESGEAVVASFHIGQDRAGSLTKLGQLPTGCGHPSHLTVHPSGSLLATAHYEYGIIGLFALDSSGSITRRIQTIQLEAFTEVIPDRQDGPHPHYVTFDPSGNYLLVPDLGADAVYIYKVDLESPALSLHDTVRSAPGAGPRHMKFSRDGRFTFVLNELSLTLDTCTWDARTGTMKPVSSIPTLPQAMKDAEPENTASEVQVHPNGRFVYAGNRGNDSISVFRLDEQSGKLDRLQIIPTRTAWPRHFALDPTGHYIVCGGQDSATVGVLSVNADSGLLTYVPHSSILVPSPICVHFVR